MARQYGVSTHLYHHRRLSRDHLLEIAAHGFETVDLVASRAHLDYHNPAVVADLQQWLAEAGLTLHGVHAPVSEGDPGGPRPATLMSIASGDPDARGLAMAEAEQALFIARRIPVRVLVVHLGWPRTEALLGGSNRDAARRSIDVLHELAAPLGVSIALEVIENDLSRAGSLVHFVEHDLESDGVGICLDIGHASRNGDPVDAVETVSGHLVAMEVHDCRGRDEHLVPFDGTIDWPAALTAVQKVGYDGPLVFEIASRGSAKDTLARARAARARFDDLMSD